MKAVTAASSTELHAIASTKRCSACYLRSPTSDEIRARQRAVEDPFAQICWGGFECRTRAAQARQRILAMFANLAAKIGPGVPDDGSTLEGHLLGAEVLASVIEGWRVAVLKADDNSCLQVVVAWSMTDAASWCGFGGTLCWEEGALEFQGSPVGIRDEEDGCWAQIVADEVRPQIEATLRTLMSKVLGGASSAMSN